MLAHLNNSTSLTLGDVVDKQWVAVNDVATSPYRDHVYAMWAVFNGNTVEVWFSKSVDRGLTFSKPTRLTPPNTVGPSNTYVIPSVDAAGNRSVAVASFRNAAATDAEIWVARSTDDGGKVYYQQVLGTLSRADLGI